MTQQYLKPAPGITIPMADGRPWPAEGALVEVDQYVRRRLAEGDIVACKPPSVVAEPIETETRKGK